MSADSQVSGKDIEALQKVLIGICLAVNEAVDRPAGQRFLQALEAAAGVPSLPPLASSSLRNLADAVRADQSLSARR